jgi:DNA mismatch repair ATPase MutS
MNVSTHRTTGNSSQKVHCLFLVCDQCSNVLPCIGYKVGRVDQAETALGAEMRLAAAKSKGNVSEDKVKEKIVRRFALPVFRYPLPFAHLRALSELNKVYTNGTLIDAELLTDEQAGHCISIREEKCADGSDTTNSFGLCVLDCSTSQFNLSAFEDDVCRTKLETLMRQLRPKELLFTKVSLRPISRFPRFLTNLYLDLGITFSTDNPVAQSHPSFSMSVDCSEGC